MKKFFGLIVLFVLALSTAIFADWTVTTNWAGSQSASIDFVVSPCSNSLETNYNLHKGFIRGKKTPTMWFVTSITNAVGNTYQVQTGGTNKATEYVVPRIEVCHVNKTNISVRVRKNMNWSLPYIKFNVIILYPYPPIK